MYRVDKQGTNFGWPYCFYDYRLRKLVLNPEYGGDGKTQSAAARNSPHLRRLSGALGARGWHFYEGNQFPAHYRGGMLIAFHGSWNRMPEERPGAVVFQPFRNGRPSGNFEVFADGFTVTPVADQSKYTGRPDGVAVAPDGSLYITDSVKGKVWRVFYKG